VQPDCVIQNTTAETLYEVPLLLAKEGLDRGGLPQAGLDTPARPGRSGARWSTSASKTPTARAHRLVGKYTQLHDAYLSVVEALAHAGTANGAVVDIKWVDSEESDARRTSEQLGDVRPASWCPAASATAASRA
jgi:CTP synthase